MQMSPEKGGAAIAAAVASKKFDRTPTNVVLAAVDQLRKDYPELFAVLPSEQDWATRLASWAKLNIPSSHSAAAVSDTFTAQYFLETGLLALLENGSIKTVITTPESEDDIAKLRKSIAAYRRVLFNEQPTAAVAEPGTDEPVQTEPTGPTEAELDAAIVNDWRTLPTSEIRSRCRVDGAYKARLDKLMAAEKI